MLLDHLPKPRGARLTWPALTAVALAAPALWWSSNRGPMDAGDPATEATVASRTLPAMPAASAVEPATPRTTDGPSIGAAPEPVAAVRVERRAIGVTPPRGGAPEDALDLKVIVRGQLTASAPGLGGAVLIRALGPDGQVVDELGRVGSPYSLHGLEPGDWLLVLRGTSTVEERVPLRIEADQRRIELDLEVDPAASVPVVFVTSWGERLESALADPERDAAGMPRIEVLGAEIAPPLPDVLPAMRPGRFRGAILGAGGAVPEVSGWLELHAPLPVEVRLVQAGRELERRRVTRLDQVQRFVIDPLEESGLPRLTGTLVDAESGEPVHDAVVELFPAGSDAPVRSRQVSGDGALTMAGIGSGEWILSAWSAGRAHLLHPFTLESELDYALGMIELPRSTTLSGQLLGPDGRALGNRSVRWVQGGLPAQLAFGYGREAVRSDSGGRFAIGGVPDGPITLIAGGDEFAADCFEFEPSELQAAQRTLEIRLAPGWPVGIAIEGPVEERFQLAIRDESGRLVLMRPAVSGRGLRVVLAGGSYTAELRRGSAVLKSRKIEITERPFHLLFELGDD
ncbi:MAG: carboxypeptidase-like regulatory domain-containing protein [Planctomycetota bacterium]